MLIDTNISIVPSIAHHASLLYHFSLSIVLPPMYTSLVLYESLEYYVCLLNHLLTNILSLLQMYKIVYPHKHVITLKISDEEILYRCVTELT